MQVLALPGFLAFFAVSMWVGIRLLLLWSLHAADARAADGHRGARHRTAGLRDRDGGVQLVQSSPGLARFLVAIASTTVATGVGAKMIFNWLIYHPRPRAARGIAFTAIALLAGSVVGDGFTNHFAPEAWQEPGFPQLRQVLQIGALCWGSAEAFGWWRRMQRRVSIGLGDPVVANRFLLWSIGAGAAGIGSAIGTVVGLIAGRPLNDMPGSDARALAVRPRSGERPLARLRAARPVPRVGEGSGPERLDVIEVPDVLPDLSCLAVAQVDAEHGGIVEVLSVALAGAAEEHRSVCVVRDHVLEREVEGAAGECRHLQQEFQDRGAPDVIAREPSAAAGKVPDGILGDHRRDRREVALLERGEEGADARRIRMLAHCESLPHWTARDSASATIFSSSTRPLSQNPGSPMSRPVWATTSRGDCEPPASSIAR